MESRSTRSGPRSTPAIPVGPRPRPRSIDHRELGVLIASSIALGATGVLVTRWCLGRLGASERDPHAWWGIGILALLPAWVIAFAGLLPDAPGERQQLASAVVWILSAAAGLSGVIATEGYLRRQEEAGQRLSPERLWCLGLIALAPSWTVMILAHVLR